ncbi:hypothetical protein OXX79_002447 [Metschnikowia pulcherrima]
MVFTLLVKVIEYQPGVQPNATSFPHFDLEEFADVVTDHLPAGLPPNGSIQHSIEIIPGSEAPHRSPYRLSLQDKKELTMQIDGLLQAGKRTQDRPHIFLEQPILVANNCSREPM